MGRTLAWFSSGAASAIMTKLALADDPTVLPVQCDLGESEDEDNRRFTADCVRWFNAPVQHIISSEYLSIDEVHEYDDDLAVDEEDDLMGECGFIPGEGVCMNAGTEWCDWECPFNICDPEGI